MANFKIAVKETLEKEGLFSDRKADAGGKTNYGITWLTAKRFGYYGSMKNLTKKKAIEIYKKGFWNPLKLDNVDSQKLANKIFDINVNCGGIVKKYLQRSLNVFNRNQKSWYDIKVDGKIGAITIGVLNRACKNKMTERNILKALNCLQGHKYITLAENPKRMDELNVNGWFNQRIN